MPNDYSNIFNDHDLLIRLLEKKISELINENIQLKEENKKLKLTFDSGDITWWELDVLSGKIDFNLGMIKQLGYSKEDISEDVQELSNLIHTDDIIPLKKLIDQIISNHLESASIDYRIKTKDGSFCWISDKIIVPERDASGFPTKLLGISFNNDEKKRFEIALNQMLNNSLFGFVVFKDDKIVFVNKNASKLIGYSREEILKFQKDDLSKIIHQEDISLFIKQFREYESFDSQSHKFLLRIINKENKTIWLKANFSKLIFNGTEALQLSFIDITDLIKTEEEKIVISEDFIRTIQELNIHIFRFIRKEDEFLNTFSAGKLAEEIDVSNSTHKRDERNILTIFGKEYYEIFHENFEKSFLGDEVKFDFTKNKRCYTALIAPYKYDEDGNVTEILGKINDSTSAFQAEQELRKTNERLEIAHSAGNIAWWELNYETRTVDCDKNYAKILGYSLEEFPSRFEERLELIHPEFLPIVEEKVKEHIDGKTEFYEITYKAKTKNGEYKWVYDRGKIVERNELDEPLKMLGVFMDVSELKAAEAKYKLEAEKGMAILRAMPDSIYIFDKEFRYIDYYVKSQDALYVKPEDFLGKRIDEVLPPVGNENVIDKHFKLLQENPNKINTFEYTLIKDKEARYYESRVVFTGSFYLVVDREITNEKRHRLKVSEIAKRFRLATKTAQMGIWDWNIEKDKLIWDSGMYRIFETEKQDALLNYDFWKMRINPADRYLVESNIQNALYKNKEFLPEYRIITSTGTTKYLKAYGQVYRDEKNKPIRMIGLNIDITDRKLMEIELEKAKEKAEQSDKLKSEFLAQMSHEIRTPVNNLLSFASLIREELEETLTEDVLESFKVMSNAGRRIIRTIDLILNMSEIQTKTYEPVYEEIDILEDILFEQRHEFKFIAKEKGLTFTIRNSAENTTIEGDRYTIGQIFNNLIDNAIKYTFKGSIEVSLYNKNEQLLVDIKDTGIGISEEYSKNIFVPFTQEDSGYTRKYEGNGLGLALVKEYCRINFADISFVSKKEEGTTFTVGFKSKISFPN